MTDCLRFTEASFQLDSVYNERVRIVWKTEDIVTDVFIGQFRDVGTVGAGWKRGRERS